MCLVTWFAKDFDGYVQFIALAGGFSLFLMC
jgi:hypothetical protein